jgi:membrane fusion protein, adhesin transport system
MAIAIPDNHEAARHDKTVLAAMQLARTPRLARNLVLVVAVVVVLTIAGLVFIPWRQTVPGTGRAMAFAPTERTQFIVAPIEGRVRKWHVVEGQKVKPGDLLVEMLDIDPDLPRRLENEADALEMQMTLALSGVSEVERRVSDIERSQSFRLTGQESLNREIERQIDAIDQDIISTKATYDTAEQALERMLATNKEAGRPLIAVQDIDNQRRNTMNAKAAYNSAKERRKGAGERLKAGQDFLVQIKADTDAAIKAEKLALVRASTEVQSVNQRIQQTNNRIARQRQQSVYASTEGTVFRILANAEGLLVRPGERLAVLVPTLLTVEQRTTQQLQQIASSIGLFSASTLAPVAGPTQLVANLSPEPVLRSLTAEEYPGIVAELFIDGNDLTLVSEGDKVRLQFEGWAAVQFVSFPQAAEGTFGGRVFLVDPTSNDKGDFRILIKPDPNDKPWPKEDLLRQGVRAQGWVLMPRDVPLWKEIWRQLNGFPPAREIEKKEETGALGPVPARKRK